MSGDPEDEDGKLSVEDIEGWESLAEDSEGSLAVNP